ncbi:MULTISPECIES: hypothetical protein [Rhodococcus]|uniref:Uncharacterized protein n=2 Tax=Rhodococcus TaxID=1827 RepID=A0ABU4D0C9_9NOCA|nr:MULTISPECIES: hypothetical protein [Rhodococcus]MDV6303145.1 hypothetical protein [Rhodococcus cerastii]MDV8054728.1 hypothetical protein [Rhodococcus sp. IEGM 1343]MDV8077103.1 hypothetical protein [Rhodococcus sp. IEGM 1370]
MTFTTSVVAAWVCLSRSWWPSPYGELTGPDRLLVALIATVALLIIGLIWAIRVLHVIGQDRRWSW